jgi:hypothetical protein
VTEGSGHYTEAVLGVRHQSEELEDVFRPMTESERSLMRGDRSLWSRLSPGTNRSLGSSTRRKRYNLVPGAPLPLFRSGKDGPDIETVLGGFVLTSAPDFVDDGILWHALFSHSPDRICFPLTVLV